MREVIAEAIKTLLADALDSKFETIGRKHIMPPTLTPDMQPALFICNTRNGRPPRIPGTPGKRTMSFWLFGYVYDDSPDEIPGQETSLLESKINELLDAIDDALEPDASSAFITLGGLVQHCWIEGDTDVDPGIFGKQGFFTIPVHVLIP